MNRFEDFALGGFEVVVDDGAVKFALSKFRFPFSLGHAALGLHNRRGQGMLALGKERFVDLRTQIGLAQIVGSRVGGGQVGHDLGARLARFVKCTGAANDDSRLADARFEHGINLSIYNATVSDNQLFYQLEVKDGHFAYKPKGFFVNVLPSINYYIKWK